MSHQPVGIAGLADELQAVLTLCGMKISGVLTSQLDGYKLI